MSVDLHVFFEPSRLTSLDDWGATAKSLGFDIEFEHGVDLKDVGGFLPCKYKGKDAGFEYGYGLLEGEELSEWGTGDPSRPACVSFATRSDFREFATSMISAAVLCHITGGVLRDADGETQIPDSKAIEWAREGEESIQTEIIAQDKVRLERAALAANKAAIPKWPTRTAEGDKPEIVDGVSSK